MKKIMWVLLFVVATVSMASAQGHHGMGPGGNREAMRQEIESLKIAHLTSVVGLTPEESAKFWPVYNKYWSDRRANKHAVHSILKEIDNNGVSQDKAKDQLAQIVKLNREESDITDRLVRDLGAVLSPDKILKVFVGEDSFKRVVLEKTRGRR